jgi:transposase-like protein
VAILDPEEGLWPSGPDGSDRTDAPLDALIGDTATPEELSALFRRLQKRLAERILAGELTDHLGYAAGEAKPAGQANHRNGSSAKTVLTETGALPLDIPRDRAVQAAVTRERIREDGIPNVSPSRVSV